jgi:hypothetical protein
VNLSDVVSVTITVSSAGAAQQNFGVPAVITYHQEYPDLMRYYTSLTGLTGDGFAVTSLAYREMAQIFAQTPHPTKVGVGRRQLPNTQVVKLTCSSSSTLDTYKFTIIGSDGVSHAISVASTGVVATDVASIESAINALSNVGTATLSTATVIITQSAGSGKCNDFLNWGLPGAAGAPILVLQDTTADPGIATDLAAILKYDNTGWYGFSLDSNSQLEVAAAATWAEANDRPQSFNNSDNICITTATTDIFTAEKTAATTRSTGIFNGSQLLNYAGAALLGVILPLTPGSYTGAFKTLANVPADPASILTETAITNLEAKNGNFYTNLAGVNIDYQTITGSGEFFDVPIFIDWLQNAIQIAVFNLLVGTLKVPFTDNGVAMVVNAIKGVLKQGIANGGLSSTPPPIVSAPLVGTLTQSQISSRQLPSVSFSATLAGAIHGVTIQGTVVLP